MRYRKVFILSLIGLLAVSFLGCGEIVRRRPKPRVYESPTIEAEWIRKGEPIEFESELWYPMDSVENLLDAEVYYLGEYRDVEFFIEKIDVRPYSYLYTKFGRNKFRTFKKRR